MLAPSKVTFFLFPTFPCGQFLLSDVPSGGGNYVSCIHHLAKKVGSIFALNTTYLDSLARGKGEAEDNSALRAADTSSAGVSTSFPGYSLYFEKVPWLRLVTCLSMPTQAAPRVGPQLNFVNTTL